MRCLSKDTPQSVTSHCLSKDTPQAMTSPMNSPPASPIRKQQTVHAIRNSGGGRDDAMTKYVCQYLCVTSNSARFPSYAEPTSHTTRDPIPSTCKFCREVANNSQPADPKTCKVFAHLWKTSHRWEDLHAMGRLPIYGKTSHLWELFPYVGLPTYGKSSHLWEVSPCMGSLPIYEK
jgi:hypothetical protein